MSGMAEVIAAHSDLQWSFEYGGFVCVECGWQETYARPYAKDADVGARASHLASVLTAAGFGSVAEAKAEALEEAAQDFEDNIGVGEFDELARRDGARWTHIDDAWEYQGPYMDWLRARAANLRKP